MSGHNHCACRDCFDVIVGEPGDMCDDCEASGCEAGEECLSAHAYGGSEDELPKESTGSA